MRRVLLAASVLAALLAGPGPAFAQAPPGTGAVTFDNAFIGAEACTSTTTNTSRQVHLAWADQPDGTSIATGGVFRVFATNVAPVASTSGAKYCQTVNNPNATGGAVYAAQVGADIPNSGGTLSGSAYEFTRAIAQAAGQGGCGTAVPIYVCVHFYPYVSNTTTPQSTASAWAVGQMTLSLTTPGPVSLDSVLPGNHALNASWSDPNSPAAAKYKVVAVSLADPTALPSSAVFNTPDTFAGMNPLDPTPHWSGFVTGTGPYRLSGLLNNLAYAVAVVAYTDAETPSDPSNVLTGVPQLVTDFWDTYKGDGGRDGGGCSSGAAGPIGLLALAGALAVARRRR